MFVQHRTRRLNCKERRLLLLTHRLQINLHFLANSRPVDSLLLSEQNYVKTAEKEVSIFSGAI
jgi:hypothetical protein